MCIIHPTYDYVSLVSSVDQGEEDSDDEAEVCCSLPLAASLAYYTPGVV